MLALAGASPITQRREDCDGRLQWIAADVWMRVRRRACRGPIGEARDHVHAGERLDTPAHAAVEGSWTPLTHGGHREVDQVWPGLAQRLIRKPEVLQHLRPS